MGCGRAWGEGHAGQLRDMLQGGAAAWSWHGRGMDRGGGGSRRGAAPPSAMCCGNADLITAESRQRGARLESQRFGQRS